MRINVNKDTLNPMLLMLKKIKSNQATKEELYELLKHSDFQFEFQRYEGRVSISEYVDYLFTCHTLEEESIENQDLKAHHNLYVDFFNNVEFYEEKLAKIHTIITPKIIDDALELAQKGLPLDHGVEEIKLVFSFGIGMSFGYVHNNTAHFDVLHLIKNASIDDFFGSLAHEIHHVCLYDYFPEEYTVKELFLLYFSAEGLAVKYCNNAVGVMSKAIYDGPTNVGLDPFSWNYLNDQFDEAFKIFQNTIKKIDSGEITTFDEVEEVINNTYMNFHTEDQSKDEKPKLLHSLLYSFGNDIYGVIHDAFGKEIVYQLVKEPFLFLDHYNKACIKLGFSKYCFSSK